jgi:very-short-patch-repair endonuclease
MKPVEQRELGHRFRNQHGLITRQELRLLGVTASEERRRRAAGEWEVAGPGVLRLAGSPRTPEQGLLAACLACGATAVASHRSAAWMWGLLDQPPDRPAVTVARTGRTRVRRVEVHRPVDYPAHVVVVRRVPCTNPLRTLVDLAAVTPSGVLDSAVDRALAKRLLTVGAIDAELRRLARQGRAGVGTLRASLRRRGLIGAPHPSVLESRTLRLLRQHGIEPLACEVKMGPDGRYRVDVLVAPRVVMEVDGFAYHSDPEQVAEDKRRRTRLRLEGIVVLDYTWRDITFDFRRVARECLAARGLAARGLAARGLAAGAGDEGSAGRRSNTPVASWPGHG